MHPTTSVLTLLVALASFGCTTMQICIVYVECAHHDDDDDDGNGAMTSPSSAVASSSGTGLAEAPSEEPELPPEVISETDPSKILAEEEPPVDPPPSLPPSVPEAAPPPTPPSEATATPPTTG